jgi:flagellar biosynthetic protein FliP
VSVTVTRRGQGPALIRSTQVRARKSAGAKPLWIMLALIVAALIALPAFL